MRIDGRDQFAVEPQHVDHGDVDLSSVVGACSSDHDRCGDRPEGERLKADFVVLVSQAVVIACTVAGPTCVPEVRLWPGISQTTPGVAAACRAPRSALRRAVANRMIESRLLLVFISVRCL
jgi:hypothetical protein